MGCSSSVAVPSDFPWPSSSSEQGSFHSRYTLSEKLGSGAFATVYATQRVDGAHSKLPLAVKIADLRGRKTSTGSSVSSSSPASSDEEVADVKKLSAVESEIQVLRKVAGQRNVVSIIDAQLDGCLAYVVLERCECTLLQALERVPSLTERAMKDFFRQMLQAISLVHSLRVVHRDIKPDNFLCGSGNVVKLSDFGLAKVIEEETEFAGLTGVSGTAPFMAPEMLAGRRYGTQVDVWSFGVCAYVMLYGKFPYMPEQNATASTVKRAVLVGSPMPDFKPRACSSKVLPAISEEATQFVQKLLRRSPESRCTAEQALQHKFLQESVSAGLPSAPSAFVGMQRQATPFGGESLRPTLEYAKLAGAFEVVHTDSGNKFEELDLRLAAMQLEAKMGRACDQTAKGRKAPELPRASFLAHNASAQKVAMGSPRSSISTAPGSSYPARSSTDAHEWSLADLLQQPE